MTSQILIFCIFAAFLVNAVADTSQGCFAKIHSAGPKVLFIGDSVERFAISDWCSFGDKGPIEISRKNKQVGVNTGRKTIQRHLPNCTHFAVHG